MIKMRALLYFPYVKAAGFCISSKLANLKLTNCEIANMRAFKVKTVAGDACIVVAWPVAAPWACWR